MFGISFSEIILIAVIALVVVGPQKLPGMLRSIGQWIARLRRLTSEVRVQTGIDEVLREEGIDGVHELRSLLRGEINASKKRTHDPYEDTIEIDENQEYPAEGVDAGGALPDDLLEGEEELSTADMNHSESPNSSSGPARAVGAEGGEP